MEYRPDSSLHAVLDDRSSEARPTIDQTRHADGLGTDAQFSRPPMYSVASLETTCR